MKKKILSGTIAAIATATTLTTAPFASAYVSQEGEYVQWDKVDEKGNRLYGSSWQLTVKNSEHDDVSTYIINDNAINPPKSFTNDEDFLPDKNTANGRFGVLLKEGQQCLSVGICDITYELKEIVPPQGYELPKNNEPIVFKRSNYSPKWGSDEMKWVTQGDDKTSFIVSPDENTKPGTYTIQLQSYYEPENAIKRVFINEKGETVIEGRDGRLFPLGIIEGDKTGTDHGVVEISMSDTGSIRVVTVDGKTHDLGMFSDGNHDVWFEVVQPGGKASEDNTVAVEQGKTLQLSTSNLEELSEGALFTDPEVKTNIVDTHIISSPLEVQPPVLDGFAGAIRVSENANGDLVFNDKNNPLFYSSVDLGKIVNTKTPPTTVEKTIIQTTTPTPSTTTVTAPPSTVTSTTTVTDTPSVVTSTKMITPEPSTVTKTPEKVTVTETPKKTTEKVTDTATVTETPEKITEKVTDTATVTETPEKVTEKVTETQTPSIETTTVTPAPVTTVVTETVIANVPKEVQTTVTETEIVDAPIVDETVYPTEQNSTTPNVPTVIEKPAKILANTGTNLTLGLGLLAVQTMLIGALVGIRNRKKNDE